VWVLAYNDVLPIKEMMMLLQLQQHTLIAIVYHERVYLKVQTREHKTSI